VNVGQGTAILLLSTGPGEGASFANPVTGFEITTTVPGTIASDALFTEPLPVANLHPYDPGEFYWGFGTTLVLIAGDVIGGAGVQIRAGIGSWVLVPEPESLALVALAALALVRRGLTAGAA
jgi:hypothetical protein